jgi:hypothetical protein
VVVAVDPALTAAAVHFMGEVGRMNAGISQLDVVPFRGAVPAGYDYAIVFAPPPAIANLALPVRTVAPAFSIVNPVDGVTARAAGPASTFALLQLGESAGTPVLAVSYHGDAHASRWIASVAAAQLATQIGGLTIVDDGGATTYDVGEKLRVSYPDDRTPGRIWNGVRLPVTLALFALLVLAGSYCARRLTGRTIP